MPGAGPGEKPAPSLLKGLHDSLSDFIHRVLHAADLNSLRFGMITKSAQ